MLAQNIAILFFLCHFIFYFKLKLQHLQTILKKRTLFAKGPGLQNDQSINQNQSPILGNLLKMSLVIDVDIKDIQKNTVYLTDKL